MKNSIMPSVLLVAALLFLGCDHGGELGHYREDSSQPEAALAKTADEDNEASSVGTLYERSFVHEGTLRSYLLYVPAAYDGETDWPLVLNYHGLLTNPAFQIELSQMNPVAEAEHFLVAYPQGLDVSFPIATGPGWAVPGGTGEQDDVDFTDELIDHIGGDFGVDPRRIHATGWSNGSFMSFYLACELSGQIASVAGVAGMMPEAMLETCEYERPVSTLYIHGTADLIAPFEGRPGQLSSALTTTAFWADRFNCSGGSITTDLPDLVVSDNSTVTLADYKGCDAGTEVLFYQVNNGGHTWPGGGTPTAPAPLGPVNRDLDASAEIWDFFARNPLPARIGERVQVCHAPPGNPSNARTITVSINALPAHLAHGDTEGPCDESS